MIIIHSSKMLIKDLRRYMEPREVSDETALRALEAAKFSYPNAADEWVIERAAYLIRRKS